MSHNKNKQKLCTKNNICQVTQKNTIEIDTPATAIFDRRVPSCKTSETDCVSNKQVELIIDYMNTKINTLFTNVLNSQKTQGLQLYKITEEYTVGTNGGNSVNNVWTPRNLNTLSVINSNTNTHVNVANATIILYDGNYDISACSSFLTTGNTKLRLWNQTLNSSIAESCNLYVSINGSTSSLVNLSATLVVPVGATYQIQLQYICEFAVPTIGLGVPCGLPNTTEIYSQLFIKRFS